jgi:uncharacterized RDD family membrane protein YckC
MKCPKCAYLGFDTGDRCKHCGYDFSLMTPPTPVPDVRIDVTGDGPSSPRMWLDERDEAQGTPATEARSRVERIKPAPALPLFRPAGEADDDEPLVKLPLAPRAPLSVRKTPDTSRLRALARQAPPAAAEPVLQFAEEALPYADLPLRDTPPAEVDRAAVAPPPTQRSRTQQKPSGAGSRVAAAFIDHAILFAIDAAVVYFTLRMASLAPSDWRVLPVAPLVVFLALLKFAYFCAFTAVGGQTIGKMALGIRVVTDGDSAVDGACAVRRTLAGMAAMVLGLGFLPALFDSERRAFHDRVARTRVVPLRSA